MVSLTPPSHNTSPLTGHNAQPVITHTPNLRQGQLVGVCQYEPGKRGPPLAVGRMAVGAEGLRRGVKGKAVLVVHTYKDKLWELGKKDDPPEPVEVTLSDAQAEETREGASEDEATPPPGSEIGEGEAEGPVEGQAGEGQVEETQNHELSQQGTFFSWHYDISQWLIQLCRRFLYPSHITHPSPSNLPPRSSQLDLPNFILHVLHFSYPSKSTRLRPLSLLTNHTHDHTHRH